MALTYHEISTIAGRGIYEDTIGSLTSGLEKRDVSDMLDLLALADTPFLNRVTWGKPSGGLSIEWISESIGPGYLVSSAAKASTATSIIFTTVEGLTTTEAVKQLNTGTVLYHYNSTDGHHGLVQIATVHETSCTIDYLSGTSASFISTSVESGDKLYILGGIVNEGSVPRNPTHRDRVQLSNGFGILRQDVAITGSMAESDYYAVSREDKHQILLRLKEMQRQRERICLYSGYVARTSTEAGQPNGCLGFLLSQSGTHIDITTTSLLETSVNSVITELWENGSRNLVAFGAVTQIAKFTQWDKNRIRMRVNDGKGGGHITSYLGECGTEIDLVPMAKVPPNIMFILDLPSIHPRAKKNRKAIMEKLGKMGDFEDWQIISEFSMEMRGYNQGQHGMFTRLS